MFKYESIQNSVYLLTTGIKILFNPELLYYVAIDFFLVSIHSLASSVNNY